MSTIVVRLLSRSIPGVTRVRTSRRILSALTPKRRRTRTSYLVIDLDNRNKQVLGTGVIMVKKKGLASHLQEHPAGAVSEASVHT
jgi:hypothetical protein